MSSRYANSAPIVREAVSQIANSNQEEKRHEAREEA